MDTTVSTELIRTTRSTLRFEMSSLRPHRDGDQTCKRKNSAASKLGTPKVFASKEHSPAAAGRLSRYSIFFTLPNLSLLLASVRRTLIVSYNTTVLTRRVLKTSQPHTPPNRLNLTRLIRGGWGVEDSNCPELPRQRGLASQWPGTLQEASFRIRAGGFTETPLQRHAMDDCSYVHWSCAQ